MEYQVTINDFVGPLDLLLHLIKEKKMDLESLEVSVITKQYLEHINQMDATLLEKMSEYLVMAAHLIEIKSKLLLPKVVIEVEGEYEEDPREILIKRLVEYKKYKDVIEDIAMLYEQRHQSYIKPVTVIEQSNEMTQQLPDNLSVYDLMRAMHKMMQRKLLSQPLDTHIAKKDITVEERSHQIISFFKGRIQKRVKLDDLFERTDRLYFVVTFMALLVLAKDHEIEIIQDQIFDEIYIEGNTNE